MFGSTCRSAGFGCRLTLMQAHETMLWARFTPNLTLQRRVFVRREVRSVGGERLAPLGGGDELRQARDLRHRPHLR